MNRDDLNAVADRAAGRAVDRVFGVLLMFFLLHEAKHSEYAPVISWAFWLFMAWVVWLFVACHISEWFKSDAEKAKDRLRGLGYDDSDLL